MDGLLGWLRRLLGSGTGDAGPSPKPVPPPKSIVTLLIFPTLTEDIEFDKTAEVGTDKYYVSSPWELGEAKLNEAIRVAEDWLADALVARIRWNSVEVVHSQRTLAEWRTRQIGLIKDEVALLGLPWTDDYIYLGFVRGMGGYAGGIRYENGNAGYAMVGDVCLEAICNYPAPTAGSVLLDGSVWPPIRIVSPVRPVPCNYPAPTAGSVLLDGSVWPPNSYSLAGQTGAFIHEALHGLDLPHPDGWPDRDQPGWDETLMGHWWNMPNFANTNGLTLRGIGKVLQWIGSSR